MSSATFRPGKRAVLSSLGALALIVVVAAPVAAATPAGGRITKGDVTAAFQARTTGAYINVVNGHLTPASVRGLQHGRISSFGDSVNCSTDWHYFGVTLLGEGGHQAAAAFLATVAISFNVDGTPLAGTTRLPIKPFVGTGIRGQFGVSVGKLIAPGSMALGDHTLETVIAVPGSDVQDLPGHVHADTRRLRLGPHTGRPGHQRKTTRPSLGTVPPIGTRMTPRIIRPRICQVKPKMARNLFRG